MYLTTRDFISSATALREALLLCLVAEKPLCIETGRPGVIPCIPSWQYRKILNADLVIQAVEVDTPHRDYERVLKLTDHGAPVQIGCNYDSIGRLQDLFSAEKPFVFLDIKDDEPIPVPEFLLNRMAYSLRIAVAPDDVVRLINFIGTDSAFADANIAALRERARHLDANNSEAFRSSVVRALRAIRPNTTQWAACQAAGLTASFGQGAAVRAAHDLSTLCAASAAIDNRGEIHEEDLVRLFAATVGHRIDWRAAQPTAGYMSALQKVAQWAVGA